MRLTVVLLLAAVLPASAQPPSTPVWMTGQRLLGLLTFPPEVKGGLDMTPAQYLDAERGRLYIEGVHDSSAGRAWCYSKQYPPGPDAVHGAALHGLRNMPPAKLRQNAADLLVEIWRTRWPCTDQRSGR